MANSLSVGIAKAGEPCMRPHYILIIMAVVVVVDG